MRRLVRLAAVFMAAQVVTIVARVVEFLTGAPVFVWVSTTLLSFALAAPGIGVSLRMRSVRLAETAERERDAARRREFLLLRAPDPRPGQCPVCSLEDLDELAVHDEFAREIDPECVRVVPYGPHRAHYACAKTVPYVAPTRSTSGGTSKTTLVTGVDERCVKMPVDGGRRVMCLVHNEGDPGCTVYPRGTLGSDADAFHSAVTDLGGRIADAVARAFAVRGVDFGFDRPPVVNHTLRDSLAAPPQWAALGVDTFAGAQLWRKHGFTPKRAKAWIQNGFCDPQVIAATGYRWPNEIRTANGLPLYFPDGSPPVVPGHASFTVEGKHTYCACIQCMGLREEGNRS